MGFRLHAVHGAGIDDEGPLEEGVVVEGVKRGHRRAIRVVEGRALEEGALPAYELPARLVLEEVDEGALDGGGERHGQGHAQRPAEARAHGDADEAHGGMDLDGAPHHEGAQDIVREILRHVRKHE